MVKPIISYGSSILTKVCNPVSNSVTAVDLIDTLKNTNGVGLAAPQIGLLEQIFITKLNNNIQIYINPIIRNRYKEQLSEEGCLSIPTIYGKIKRADIIDIEYLASLCKPRNILLVVDNCFATPAVQQPINLGADLVLHSDRKSVV